MNTIGPSLYNVMPETGREISNKHQSAAVQAEPSEKFSAGAGEEPDIKNEKALKTLASSIIAASKANTSSEALAASGMKTAEETASSLIPSPAGQLVRILFTDDIHGTVLPSPSKQNPMENKGGMSMLSSIIKEKKSEAPSLLLDAGDWAQGTFVGGHDKGETIVKLMNALGYDASAIGNHEFDWGTSNLEKLSQIAEFDVLASNIMKEDGSPVGSIAPHVIKEINGVKVGIIGAVSEDTPFETSSQNTAGIEFGLPSDTVADSVKELKEQGAEAIILLSHCGTEADIQLAKKTEGIDLIISGHDHGTLASPIKSGNTTIVEAGPHTSNIGSIDMYVDKKTGKTSFVNHNLTPIDSKHSKPDPEFEAVLKPVNEKLDKIMNEKIGETSVSISRKGDSAESVAGNLVTDGIREATGADVAFVNTAAMKREIPAGAITFGKVCELIPYENEIVTVEMTGEQLKAVLEDSASHAEEIPKYGNRYALQCSGIRETVNPFRQIGDRCHSITINGEPIDLNKTYKVASIDYLVTGSNEFPSLHGGSSLVKTGIDMRDAFISFIKEHGPFDHTNASIEGRQVYSYMPVS